MTWRVVAAAEDLPEGERLVVGLEGTEIAVFNIDGEYYAYTNWCAHQGGPACEGPVAGTQTATFDPETLEVSLDWTDSNRYLSCPWHGWEFDVTTGDCLSRNKVRLIAHDVREEDGDIVVSV